MDEKFTLSLEGYRPSRWRLVGEAIITVLRNHWTWRLWWLWFMLAGLGFARIEDYLFRTGSCTWRLF